MSVATSTLAKCQVVYKSITYTMTGCSADIANRMITVSSGFNIAVSAGDSIAITFGLATNPNT